MTIIYAIIIFLLLIFVHEFGHFIAAKLCDVKVNEFSLGMGPALFKKQGRETLYALRAVPIGGYCAMEGEEEDSEDSRALNKKNGWQKCIIFAAGALMNIILAVIIMICISLANGSPTTTVELVTEGMPAEQAGIMAGDEITAINGEAVDSWEDVTEHIQSGGDELVFTVLRDGASLEFTVPVEYNEEEKRPMVGITSTLEHDPGKAVVNGVRSTGQMTVDMYHILAQLFTGEVSTKELSGPVGIMSAVSQSSKMGFVYIAYLTALISLNLAVINLLPFPALDGGRIVFLVIRKITGRRVTDRVENGFHMAGMMLLLALMVYVTFNDIGRLLS